MKKPPPIPLYKARGVEQKRMKNDYYNIGESKNTFFIQSEAIILHFI